MLSNAKRHTYYATFIQDCIKYLTHNTIKHFWLINLTHTHAYAHAHARIRLYAHNEPQRLANEREEDGAMQPLMKPNVNAVQAQKYVCLINAKAELSCTEVYALPEGHSRRHLYRAALARAVSV